MNKLIISLFLPASLIVSFCLTSCGAGESEFDSQYARDTVVVNVDTIIKEQKKTERVTLNLYIQLASFGNRAYAEDFLSKAKASLNMNPEIRTENNNLFVITIGTFSDNRKAEEYLVYVKARGFKDAFIKNF